MSFSITTNTNEFGISSLKMLVSPAGRRKKSPIARISENAIVPAHAAPPISCCSPFSSSVSWAFAEMPSALKPILSDSPSATTPRMIGSRYTRWRFVHDTSGSETTSISPSGISILSPRLDGLHLHLATACGRRRAQVETPRIITPSRTAWPPTGASR